MPVAHAYHTFAVGEIACAAISDGTARFSPAAFFANAPPDLLRAALIRHGLPAAPSAKLETPLNCLLLRTAHGTALIDTGMGPDAQPGTGNLVANLTAAGWNREEIDLVILSHAHPDHIGGCLDAAGEPAFSRARYVLSEAEWRHWMEVSGAGRPRAVLEQLRAQIELIVPETEVLPGVRALAASGHSPGQLAFWIESGLSRLLYTADAIAHPIHLEHPDWNIKADSDRAQAISTRKHLLARAVTEDARLFVYHFPFPGLYRLARDSEGWRAEPDSARWGVNGTKTPGQG